MPEFADRVSSVGPNPFLSLNQAKAKIEAESGQKVLDLGVGSPDFPPSKIFIEELKARYDNPDSHMYPGFPARPELAEAITAFYFRNHNVFLSKGELYPLNGAKEGIANLAATFLNSGDEALIPDPGYPTFSSSVAKVGAKAVGYSLTENNDFKIDFSELNKKISGKTKFIWVNFPSNPTGQVATAQELGEMVSFARRNNICLLYDNAYAEITFGDFKAPSILEIEGAKEVAVELRSYSKTFSFAGYRMAWIAGNEEIIKALAVIKSDIDSGLSLPLQKLGAFALNSFNDPWCQQWRNQMLESYRTRRDSIAELLKALGLEFTLPLGSLYIWAKILTGQKSMDFCTNLLRERKINLTPGSSFGKNGEGYIRAAICADVSQIKNYS